MKLYITFGQDHAHAVNGKTFDKDSICEIEGPDYSACRKKAFEVFGPKFAFDYEEGQLPGMIHYFPRGIIPLEN